MQQYRRPLLALAAYLGVLGLCAILAPRPGLGDPPDRDVRVVNTTAQAVPVRGTVQALQEGAWDVGIAGTPTVLLSPDARVGIAPSLNTVRVGNPGSDPVPVRDTRLGQERFFLGFASLPEGLKSGANHVPNSAVPAGKRLVIRSLWAEADLPPGQRAFLTVRAHPDGFNEFRVPMGPTGVLRPFSDGEEREMHLFDREVLLYHQDVNPMIVELVRSASAGTGFFHVRLFGYLVPAAS